jgi:hypothetical protein
MSEIETGIEIPETQYSPKEHFKFWCKNIYIKNIYTASNQANEAEIRADVDSSFDEYYNRKIPDILFKDIFSMVLSQP